MSSPVQGWADEMVYMMHCVTCSIDVIIFQEKRLDGKEDWMQKSERFREERVGE